MNVAMGNTRAIYMFMFANRKISTLNNLYFGLRGHKLSMINKSVNFTIWWVL